MARFNFAAVETAARGVGAAAAPVARGVGGTRRAAGLRAPPGRRLAGRARGCVRRPVGRRRPRACADGADVRCATAARSCEIDPGSPTTGDAAVGSAARTVVVFVHGLGNHESMWGQSYLDVVRAHGATPLTVRYTTGQAIADSGAELADLLDRLVAAWPVAVERIVLVGHSMGGLVIREGLAAGGHWRGLVTDVITLGTPHSGAPLERVAVRGLALASSLPVDGAVRRPGRRAQHRDQGPRDRRRRRRRARARTGTWSRPRCARATPSGVLGRARVGPARAPGRRPGHRRQRVRGRRATSPRAALVIDDASHMALLDHPEAADVLRAGPARPRESPPLTPPPQWAIMCPWTPPRRALRRAPTPPPWLIYLAVFAGGMLGGTTRYLIGLAIPAQPGQIPWGILGVNLVGAFIMGLLLHGWVRRGHVSHPWRPFLATGILGSFTTWSTFMADTYEPVRRRRRAPRRGLRPRGDGPGHRRGRARLVDRRSGSSPRPQEVPAL